MGAGSLFKLKVVGEVRVVDIQIQLQGWWLGLFKTEGSLGTEDSNHSDSASRMGVGTLYKRKVVGGSYYSDSASRVVGGVSLVPKVVGIVRVSSIQIQSHGWWVRFRFSFVFGDGVSLKTEGSWVTEGSCHSDLSSRVRVGSF